MLLKVCPEVLEISSPISECFVGVSQAELVRFVPESAMEAYQQPGELLHNIIDDIDILEQSRTGKLSLPGLRWARWLSGS